MISNRSEYDFVTIDDGLIVNGGIMPVRPDKETLRAEDPAFCHEGVMERFHTIKRDTSSITVTRAIDSHTFSSVANNIVTLFASNRIIKPQYYFQNIFVDSSYISPTAKISDYYPDALMTETRKSDPNDFFRGASFRQQPIMNIYEDLSNIRAFQGMIKGTADKGTFSREGSMTGGDCYGAYLVDNLAMRYRKDEKERDGYYTLKASGGDIVITEFSNINTKYVETIKIIVPIRLSTSTSMGKNETRHLFIVYTHTMDTDQIKISRSDLASWALLGLGTSGYGPYRDSSLPRPPDDQYYANIGACSAFVLVDYIMAAVELGDHTRF